MLSPMDYLLLELYGGLSNAVAPSLRAVTVDIDEVKKVLCFFFFYDGKITDELFEFASIAVTETGAMLFNYTAEFQIIQLDYPEEIPIRGKVAYYRYEPHLPKFQKQNRAHLLQDPEVRPVTVLILDMRDALLGKVTPNLRLVSVDVDVEQKILKYCFIYDGEISEENFQLATQAVQEAGNSFPGFSIEKRVVRVDFPHQRGGEGLTAVYMRYEEVT